MLTYLLILFTQAGASPYTCRGSELMQCTAYIAQQQVGSTLELQVLRGGQPLSLSLRCAPVRRGNQKKTQ